MAKRNSKIIEFSAIFSEFFFQVYLVTLTKFFWGVSHVPGPVNETKISLGMVTVTPPNELIVLVQYAAVSN